MANAENTQGTQDLTAAQGTQKPLPSLNFFVGLCMLLLLHAIIPCLHT